MLHSQLSLLEVRGRLWSWVVFFQIFVTFQETYTAQQKRPFQGYETWTCPGPTPLFFMLRIVTCSLGQIVGGTSEWIFTWRPGGVQDFMFHLPTKTCNIRLASRKHLENSRDWFGCHAENGVTIRNDHLGIIQLNMGISDCHAQLQKRNYSVPDSIFTYRICAFASECFVFLQPAEELPCSKLCPASARLVQQGHPERCAAAGFEDAAAFGRSEAAGANLEPRACDDAGFTGLDFALLAEPKYRQIPNFAWMVWVYFELFFGTREVLGVNTRASTAKKTLGRDIPTLHCYHHCLCLF